MTKEQLALTITNLEKVYNELPELAKEIPSIKTDFDMSQFGVFEGIDIEYILNFKKDPGRNICGTGGCLIGNAARLFPVKVEYRDSYKEYSYSRFGEDVFPALYKNSSWIDDEHRVATKDWNFVFDGDWWGVLPTFEHAMERLFLLIEILKKGETIWHFDMRLGIPETFESVMTQPIVFEDEPEQA